jgi:hypothetical protein
MARVRTDVAEESIAFFIEMSIIGWHGETLTLTNISSQSASVAS